MHGQIAREGCGAAWHGVSSPGSWLLAAWWGDAQPAVGQLVRNGWLFLLLHQHSCCHCAVIVNSRTHEKCSRYIIGRCHAVVQLINIRDQWW